MFLPEMLKRCLIQPKIVYGACGPYKPAETNRRVQNFREPGFY